jgi:ankyrin repeat protein
LLATECGLTKTVLRLIEKDAVVNQKRKSNGYTALHCAARLGYTTILNKLLASKRINADAVVESGDTALHISASKGHLEAVRLLAEDFAAPVNVLNKEKLTPLMRAIKAGQSDTACYLAKRSNVDEKGPENSTCSLMAAQNNLFEVADILIERGENPTAKNMGGLCYL